LNQCTAASSHLRSGAEGFEGKEWGSVSDASGLRRGTGGGQVGLFVGMNRAQR